MKAVDLVLKYGRLNITHVKSKYHYIRIYTLVCDRVEVDRLMRAFGGGYTEMSDIFRWCVSDVKGLDKVARALIAQGGDVVGLQLRALMFAVRAYCRAKRGRRSKWARAIMANLHSKGVRLALLDQAEEEG